MGLIVGWQGSSSGNIAYLIDNGIGTNLGKLGSYYYDGTYAYDINNLGQIVGNSSVTSTTTHAYVWQSGNMSDLGTLGGNDSYAFAINEEGQIVGFSETSNGDLHATIWFDGMAIDLSDLIPTDSGWDYLCEAYDINDNGLIVGYGRLNGNIFDRAFLLTPIPEPATLSLLAFGGLVLIYGKRK